MERVKIAYDEKIYQVLKYFISNSGDFLDDDKIYLNCCLDIMFGKVESVYDEILKRLDI